MTTNDVAAGRGLYVVELLVSTAIMMTGTPASLRS